MIKVEAIEEFALKDFGKLVNIERKGREESGKLFVGDTFECDEEMAQYLLGNNPLKKQVINIVEIQPEKKEEPKEEVKEAEKELPKKKKKKSSKK